MYVYFFLILITGLDVPISAIAHTNQPLNHLFCADFACRTLPQPSFMPTTTAVNINSHLFYYLGLFCFVFLRCDCVLMCSVLISSEGCECRCLLLHVLCTMSITISQNTGLSQIWAKQIRGVCFTQIEIKANLILTYLFGSGQNQLLLFIPPFLKLF